MAMEKVETECRSKYRLNFLHRLTYTVEDFAREYAEEKRKQGSKYNLTKDRELYKQVSKDILKTISKLIIQENLVFKVPERLGHFLVVKEKLRFSKESIDYKNTKKYKKKIIYNNLHTRQFVFSYYWYRTGSYASFTNLGYYNFRFVRDEKYKEVGKRGLAAYISKCESERKDYDAPEKRTIY